MLALSGTGNKGELARGATMDAPRNIDGKYLLGADGWYRDPETGEVDEAIIRNAFLKPQPVLFADGVLSRRRNVLSVACGCYHFLAVALELDGALNVYASGLNHDGQVSRDGHTGACVCIEFSN